MSSTPPQRRQSEDLESVTYGVLEKDLATDRAVVEDFELLRLPVARSLTPLDVPAECYLRFGSQDAPQVDLRDHVGQEFRARGVHPDGTERTMGAVYLENPTGVTGTLRLFHGSEVGVAGNPEIGEIAQLPEPVQTAAQAHDTIETGQQAVSAAGTAEALNGGASLAVPDGAVVQVVAIVAADGDRAFVGDDTVTSGTGVPLADGDRLPVPVDDVASIFVDADTNGDGVAWSVVI